MNAVAALTAPTQSRTNSSATSSNPVPRRLTQQHSAQRQPTTSPIVKAHPVMNGNKLCRRYISKQGCAGRDGGCVVPYRGHFNPLKLSAAVVAHIAERFGGLAPAFTDIPVDEESA
ncbi:hypothetical protein PHMEG_00032380 [Phytophthora megakarya]|uniref:Uncharacterized protein n=1 Tax=Phytophthora megakarya TaxID=4795 RepID=A0A225UW29_9STRA|nr:hypothetical protein PHMEG_00032380 [Phytophthora megakarya]